MRISVENAARVRQFDLSEPIRIDVTGDAGGRTSAPSGSASIASPATSPAAATTKRTEPSLPLEPPGFEDALRAYFEALRGGGGDNNGAAP